MKNSIAKKDKTYYKEQINKLAQKIITKRQNKHPVESVQMVLRAMIDEAKQAGIKIYTHDLMAQNII